MDLISVIVPVYNAEFFLHRCVDSILAQTYTNIEILLVDDGSADSSGKICDEYMALDHRIRAFHMKNSGVAVARNKALDYAQGTFIAFVDSDDYIEPVFLESLYGTMTESGSDLVICGYYKELSGGKIKTVIYHGDRYADQEETLCAVFEDNSCGGYLWNKLFKRSVIDEASIRFEPAFIKCEDLPFIYQYVKSCSSAAYITEPIYHYSYNNTSICRGVKKNNTTAKEHALLSAHDMIWDSVRHDSDKVKHAFCCRQICTHMRVLVNMFYFTEKDQEQMRRSRDYIRTNLKHVLNSPLRSFQEKAGALCIAVHPRLFWMLYGILYNIFGFTIS